MKVTTRNVEFKSENLLNVCVDVHKVDLFFYARLPSEELSDKCINANKKITRQLKKFEEEALTRGYEGIKVICEPTGLYDRKLLRMAHDLGMATSYVNTENVARYRQIETNDNGKTDTKDPKIMASLAEQGKLLKIRDYGEKYMTLRKLGAISEHSVLHQLPKGYIKCIEEDLNSLYEICIEAIERKAKIEDQMIDILNELRKEDPNIPPPTPE